MEDVEMKEEQPIAEQANVSSETNFESADSCEGSSSCDTNVSLGKFKSTEALLDAYNSLQAEFTKKCQKISELEREKTFKESPEAKNERLDMFLSKNRDAFSCKEEFMAFLDKEEDNSDSMDGVWAKFVLSKLSSSDENYGKDPIVDKYIFQDEFVRNKILENYIKELNYKKPPVIMRAQSDGVVAEQKPATPSTLGEAKKIVEDMFS